MNNKLIFRWKIKRASFQDEQTLGKMDVLLFNEFKFSLATLEQEMSNNEPNDSCILPDYYIVVPHTSPTHGKCFKVLGVQNRSDILFHKLNFYRQSKGCIGVGLIHADIDNDGCIDVSSSRKAMNKLIDLCWNENAKILLEIS